MSQTSGDLRIETYDAPPEGWDAFVRRQEGFTFCHLSGWHDVMTRVMGHRCRWAVAADGGGRIGALPLVRVKSLLFGDYLLSMPFLNDGGPLGTPEAKRALAEHAAQEARGDGVDLLELRVREELPVLDTSTRKVTVLLELPDDAEVLWKDLKSKVRSQVRRPRKEGMEFRSGAAEAEAFYSVFSVVMRDLGTPVLPWSFFSSIRESLAEEVVFGAVYLDDVPVAGACGFDSGDEFEITWAAALWDYNRMAPNMLLYWSLMERAIDEGLARFNFGRCTPGGGTHRFKLQWGGYDVPLPWAQWSPGGVDATPSPEKPLYQRATRMWSRLPLAVANRVGPFLARRLP